MNYCIDTGVLISSWNLWYSLDTHPTFWVGLEDLAQQGLLKMPEQVLEELSLQKDGLHAWCKDRKKILCYEATDATEEMFAQLANRYSSLVGTLGMGNDYADLYVISLAAVHDAAVITFERFHSNKQIHNYGIPNVCHDEEIDFITPYEFIRREGWVFRHI